MGIANAIYRFAGEATLAVAGSYHTAEQDGMRCIVGFLPFCVGLLHAAVVP